MRKDTLRRHEEEDTADRILNNLGLTWESLKGKTILDIGAADAALAKAGLRRGITIISIDKDVDYLDKYWKRHLPKKMSYILADARNLPFPDECFDIAIAHASVPLIHTKSRDDIRDVLSETYRVLKPKGQFRFGDCAEGTIHPEILEGGTVPNMFRWADKDRNIARDQARTLAMLQEVFPQINRRRPKRKLNATQQYYILRKPPKAK